MDSYLRTGSAMAVLLLLTGCHGNSARGRIDTLGAASRTPRDAQASSDAGLRCIDEGDLEGAEQKFREAISRDLYCVSAHNNLGLVLLRQQRFYEAATEFDYAAKLAPRATEPRANLGLLYEAIGRSDRAIQEYEAALEIDPSNVASMQHLARTYTKIGKDDDDIIQTLQRLFEIPTDQQWDYWVRGQLIRLGRAENAVE